MTLAEEQRSREGELGQMHIGQGRVGADVDLIPHDAQRVEVDACQGGVDLNVQLSAHGAQEGEVDAGQGRVGEDRQVSGSGLEHGGREERA